MPPSVAVPIVKEAARDWLSEGEMVLFPEFEHAAHRFLPFRLTGGGRICRNSGIFSKG